MLGFFYLNREFIVSLMLFFGIIGGKVCYFKIGYCVRYIEGGFMEFIFSQREDIDFDGKMINVIEIEQYF